MSVSSVGGSPSISGLASSHTIQAFVELAYVQTANNVLTSQMASLESSLATTQNVINSLTQLQNLHNLINVLPVSSLPSNYYSAKVTASVYRGAASSLFAHPVYISVSFAKVSGGYNGFNAQMQSIVSQLNSEITKLSANTPVTSAGTSPNSLLEKVKLVLKNITSTGAAASLSGAKNWVTDNYEMFPVNLSTFKLNRKVIGSGGVIQQNLTNAITAGQSLNTTQTEAVRNFLYIYEEYYKSASAVLQAISQVIQKIAAHVSGV